MYISPERRARNGKELSQIAFARATEQTAELRQQANILATLAPSLFPVNRFFWHSRNTNRNIQSHRFPIDSGRHRQSWRPRRAHWRRPALPEVSGLHGF